MFFTVLILSVTLTVCTSSYTTPQTFNIDIYLGLYEQKPMAIHITSIDSGSSYDCGSNIISGKLESRLSSNPIDESFSCTAPNKKSKTNVFQIEYATWPDEWNIDQSLISKIPKDQWKEVVIKQTDISSKVDKVSGTHAYFSLDFSTTLNTNVKIQPDYSYSIDYVEYYNSETTWRGLEGWH